MRAPRSVTPERLLLLLIVAGGLALRLANVDYGLPFVWSLDEGTHFTNRAVLMFREGLDPGYYQNPPLLTELLHLLLRVMYGPTRFFLDLPAGGVVHDFERDPTRIWIVARALVAVLCMVGVTATYWTGRRLWGPREGLVAAAVLAFSFLAVAYSRVAVSDAGSLAGVALALYACVRLAEGGRRRHGLLTGAAIGLALSFKYTAGLLLLPLALAAGARSRADGPRRAVLGFTLAALAAGAVLVALNPVVLLNLAELHADLRDQAEITANARKPGQHGGGLSYYAESLGWGIGWAAALAAVAGGALEARRDRVRALVLSAFPLALFAYLALQSRYFGRWLLPAYPALALLAGVALVRASELVRPRALQAAALAALTLAAIAQPLAAGARTAAVLGRDDTREQVRDFLVRDFPPELRLSVEPAVPGRWFRVDPEGVDPQWLSRCRRRGGWREAGWSYPVTGGRRVCRRSKPGQFTRPDGGVAASAYHVVLDSRVIDDYRRHGYCTIVTFSVVRDRALATGDRHVSGYYRRLERESKLIRRFSPYDGGAEPVPFNFDLSYNYEPPAYHRPGPLADVYRLRDCRQGFGAPAVRIPRGPRPDRSG
ncbi:MAG: glycosyltransferase family 39 protein [Actinomycetota bacterium]|nr:glycosyltransferase family 39 protein [Actinomycetota bacterium]